MPLSVEVSGYAATSYGFSTAVSSITVSGISTTSSPDIIYAFVSTFGSGGVTMSGGGLTWNTRIPQWFSPFQWGQSFYAVANSTLSAVNITAGFGVALSGVGLAVVSIAGANTTSPFDTNTTVPLTVSGNTPGAQSGVMSTTNANDILIGMLGGDISGAGTPGSGWTSLSRGYANDFTTATEYLIVSAAQTSAPVSFMSGWTGNFAWVLGGDAIVQSLGGAFFQHSGPLRLARKGFHH